MGGAVKPAGNWPGKQRHTHHSSDVQEGACRLWGRRELFWTLQGFGSRLQHGKEGGTSKDQCLEESKAIMPTPQLEGGTKQKATPSRLGVGPGFPYKPEQLLSKSGKAQAQVPGSCGTQTTHTVAQLRTKPMSLSPPWRTSPVGRCGHSPTALPTGFLVPQKLQPPQEPPRSGEPRTKCRGWRETCYFVSGKDR